MHSVHGIGKETKDNMYISNMKRKILITFIIMFIAIITVEAKEMNLWCNDKGAEEFASLALEEQYTSYINSFKDIRDVREQPMKWAKRMVKQYGRDVIPLMNETISSSSFDHLLNEPYDSTWTCLCYLFIAFIERQLLTENEIQLYIQIIQAKMDNYVLKFRKVDKTLYCGIALLYSFGVEIVSFPEELQLYYEQRLNIKDIEIGTF